MRRAARIPRSLEGPAPRRAVERLIRLGRARSFDLARFRRELASSGGGEKRGELLARILTSWTGLRFTSRSALASWASIERLFETMRERLDEPVGLQTVLLHHFHSRSRQVREPHWVPDREWKQLRASAITDALTGLYNRRFLADMLTRQISRASRSDGILSVVMMDLEGFKSVNDRLGHLAGDRVLNEMARVVRQSLRPGDIACRWGGDEFVAVLPAADLFASFAVAERIRRKINEAAPQWRHGLRLGLYYGVASFPSDGKSVDELLRTADHRLYQCRDQWRFDGGNRRQHPRFSPERLRLRLRSGRDGRLKIARVVNVGYGGLAFAATAEPDWHRARVAELSEEENREGHPIRIRITHEERLEDGELRVGCSYA